MPGLYESTKRIRDKHEARFHFYSTAYYYCNHSKKQARLRKKMTESHNRVLYWEGILERWERIGLK